jgi:phosphoribosylformylglycinamidine synthase
LDEVWSSAESLEDLDVMETLLTLLNDPAIGSSAWIHEQYDHMLFLNTVVGPGGDGSLLRIKGTNKALAVSTDGDGRLCYLDPRRGAARLVYEAALNVAVTGARPLAVVDNLNFGNPEKPEVMWQLKETVEGISEACEALGIPVVGGNVSFYNETGGVDIHPTPVVGLLGLADPMPASPPRLSRAEEGMEVWVVGPTPTSNPAGSATQRVTGGGLRGRPTGASPDIARRVIELAADLAHQAPALHDISDGGLAVTIAEICIASGVGAQLDTTDPTTLFSEDPHRFVAVIEGRGLEIPAELATRIGTIGGHQLVFGSYSVELSDVARSWRDALPTALSG